MRHFSHSPRFSTKLPQASREASAILPEVPYRRSVNVEAADSSSRGLMTQSKRRLGIFDSGLRGLTVLGAIRALVAATDVHYYADTIHVPYGDRQLEQVAGFARRIIHRLLGPTAAAIVIACGPRGSAF